MYTYSGKRIDPTNADPEMLDIVDIAHSLSLTCRYNGHCKNFFSVAEHSVAVAKLLSYCGAPCSIQMEGLLHDAAEAYLGDIIRPVKNEMQELNYIENDLLFKIFKKFGQGKLPGKISEIVKQADDILLVTEAEHILVGDISKWPISALPIDGYKMHDVLPDITFNWSPTQAYNAFIKKFTKLSDQLEKI
jgi:hypothetical protein